MQDNSVVVYKTMKVFDDAPVSTIESVSDTDDAAEVTDFLFILFGENLVPGVSLFWGLSAVVSGDGGDDFALGIRESVEAGRLDHLIRATLMLCLVSRIPDVVEKAGVLEEFPRVTIETMKGAGLVEKPQGEAGDLIGMVGIRVVLPCESKNAFFSGKTDGLFRHSHVTPV